MKSTLSLLCTLVAATLAAAAILPTDKTPAFSAKEVRQGYREHVILARPHGSHRATIDDEESRDGINVREKFSRFGDLRVIELAETESADDAIARLRSTGRYEFVEPDYIRYIKATPNDPKFADGSLWALNNTGQTGNVEGVALPGVAGADIKATAAWDIIHDAPNVIVAVVDTGINLTHQDIVANLWTNPSTAGTDVHGANFVGGGGRMINGNPTDDNGHGTHVAGTIGAVGNNGTTSTGVAWKVQLMAVKVMNSSGQGTSTDIIAGINYAINHGASIINASFGDDATSGSTSYSPAELSAITGARNVGVIFVAAAGNESANLDVDRSYPASFALDNIVTVGASTRRDGIASFSNYGAAIDLYAPGDDIVSLDYASSTGTKTFNGTSMAAPHVAGAFALLKAQFPNDTYRQLINRMLRGVDRGTDFAGKAQSGGRLNLFKALTTTTNRPFNDDFADRPHFNTDNLTIRASNVGGTTESAESSIQGQAATASLWWEWTAPASGNVTVSTSGSSYDTLLAVYTGTSLNALTSVVSNDDDTGVVTSRATFAAQAGTTYQIEVAGKNGGTGLTMLSLGTTPANDAFASPVTLTGQSIQLTATNLHCSREVGEPIILGQAGGNSLWYQWTAPRTGRFQVSARSTEFDPILAVYTGTSLTALTPISASDNTGSDSAQTAALCTIDATAGTTYRITVDSKTASTSGQFTLTLVDSLWQATTGDAVTGSPAIGSDGTIYVGGVDKSFYAFAPDGSQKWSVVTGGSIDTCSAAIADDGTVYFGSFDGYLYAVSPSNGAVVWKHQIGSSTVDTAYSPAIGADGTIYTRASDGYLHALRPSDGLELWKKSIVSTATNFYGNPVVGADGTIYEGSDETDHKLYAVAPDGSTKWTQNLDSGVYGAPAIDANGNLYLTTLANGVYSFTASGTQRWYTKSGLNISSSVALNADGSTMYYGGYDALLYARDTATGNVRWKYSLGAEVRASSPAVDANGVIYIGCYDHKLYAINADGSTNRVYDTGDVVRSSPAIAGTRLYFGSNDQKLYAFDLGVGPAAGPWPQYRSNARRVGRTIAVTAAPTVTVAPVSQSVLVGGNVSFTVAASGSPTIQWQKNGVNLTNGGNVSGATSATLTLTNISSADAANYTAVLTNSVAAVTTAPATLSIGTAADPGRIVNMSVLTAIGADENFSFGYYLGGAGTSGPKPILMRAMGPSLVTYQVSPTLPNPYMEFYLGTTLTATNDDWGNDPTIAAVGASVGAFPFVSATSKDAAIYSANVPQSGQHSIHVFSHDNGSGFVIAELYDATSSAAWTSTTPRLINVSVMKNVGSLTTVGFNITGSTSVKVLVRAVGPTLGNAPFNMAGTMADPKIALYSQSNTSTPIDTNDNWGGGADVKAAFDAAGAFGLAANSKDAALLKTLSAGGYSVQVSAASGASGIAIIEVYEVP